MPLHKGVRMAKSRNFNSIGFFDKTAKNTKYRFWPQMKELSKDLEKKIKNILKIFDFFRFSECFPIRLMSNFNNDYNDIYLF